MDQEAVEDLSRVSKEARQKWMCRGICQEAIKLEEKDFFKGGKAHKDECNKQDTQIQIQLTC